METFALVFEFSICALLLLSLGLMMTGSFIFGSILFVSTLVGSVLVMLFIQPDGKWEPFWKRGKK